MTTNAAHPICTVCGTENSEHATICTSCGSFLQNRVPTLDLFRTAWGVLEHPERTFRTITRAEHKNYAFFLFALGGILPGMICFHYFRAGLFFPSLLTLIPLGVIVGFLFGTLTAPLGAGVLGGLSRLVGGDGSFRNGLGIAAYALVPTIMIGIVTLPIQWLTFGEYQYTLNPHPDTINVVSYWMLNVLQWAAAVWSGVLLLQGVRVSMRLGTGKAVIPALGTIAVVGGAWILVFMLLKNILEQADLYYVY